MAEEMGGGEHEHTGAGPQAKHGLHRVPIWVWIVGAALLAYITWRIISANSSSGTSQSVPAGGGGVSTDVQSALDAQKASLEQEFAAGLTTQGQSFADSLTTLTNQESATSTQLTADEATIANLQSSLTKAQADVTANNSANGLSLSDAQALVDQLVAFEGTSSAPAVWNAGGLHDQTVQLQQRLQQQASKTQA